MADLAIIAINSQDDDTGDTVSIQVETTGGDGSTISWSITGNPPGTSIDQSGLIAGTLTTEGSYTPTVSAMQSGTTATSRFIWNVAQTLGPGPDPDPPDPTQPTVDPTQGGVPGKATNYRLAFHIPALGDLPAWSYWNGTGRRTIDGIEYEPGETVRIRSHTVELTTAQPFMIDINADDTLLRAWMYQGPGIRQAELRILFRDKVVDTIYGMIAGVLENETYGFTLSIDSEQYAPTTRVQTRWSDTAQRALYPNDAGLSNLVPISQGLKLTWPG